MLWEGEAERAWGRLREGERKSRGREIMRKGDRIWTERYTVKGI